ncbi:MULTISPECIES: DUF692 domain-containing protein [unclassified Iodidimonas]|jgi:uncharacterized protein (UPF0276 family)|uniref:MNIO family bufferin maturase n=1 Tax=unclassified Iodidimonas TaxID=2626145 RepID=UPI0024822A60|nr:MULTISPECIES: DUF692 domain-containing protein [unclassified Iodidimonas]
MPLAQPEKPMPHCAGVGLKVEHYRDVLNGRPDLGFFEVHPENYMLAGGPRLQALEGIRAHYPLSLHGVGASLGSKDPVDRDHLERLKALQDRFEPFVVSEHLSWSRFEDHFLSDLLPMPLTRDALTAMAANVGRMQDALGRTILIENPSTYLEFAHAEMSEPDFLNELVKETGCGLLLDINNIHVCASNHGFDPHAYLAAIPGSAIGEIHMAGHAIDRYGARDIRIDTHGAPICDDVWALYDHAIGLFGPRPTLIERDDNLPPFADLLAEAQKAERIMAGKPSSSFKQSHHLAEADHG